MSATKRMLLEPGRLDEATARERHASAEAHREQFAFRLATRRRDANAVHRCWDRLWPIAIDRAVRSLGVEVSRINDGVFFKTAEEQRAVVAAAGVEWSALSARLSSRPTKA